MMSPRGSSALYDETNIDETSNPLWEGPAKGMAMTSYIYKATCLRVVDGDTFDLQVDVGFYLTYKQRFRLLGVDTPELRSSVPSEREAAQRAKDFVIEELTGRELEIHTLKSDSFGRWLASVFYEKDGRLADLAQELLNTGLAVRYGSYLPWGVVK